MSKKIKTAKDYPVTFDYNAYDWRYYFPWRRHKGQDRPTPIGTKVILRKTLIGATGSSGRSSGPHIHTSKWQSFIVNFLGFPRNYFKPVGAFDVEGRVVYAGWLGSAGRCVIIKQDRKGKDRKRVFYMYAHLSAISVKRNDWIR